MNTVSSTKTETKQPCPSREMSIKRQRSLNKISASHHPLNLEEQQTMMHLQPLNPPIESHKNACRFSDDSSELSSTMGLSSRADISSASILSVKHEVAPLRKKARTERDLSRSIRRRGAQLHPQLLKDVMAASMSDDADDDEVESYDPLLASKSPRDSESCSNNEMSPSSGVDDMFTVMSMKTNQS